MSNSRFFGFSLCFTHRKLKFQLKSLRDFLLLEKLIQKKKKSQNWLNNILSFPFILGFWFQALLTFEVLFFSLSLSPRLYCYFGKCLNNKKKKNATKVLKMKFLSLVSFHTNVIQTLARHVTFVALVGEERERKLNVFVVFVVFEWNKPVTVSVPSSQHSKHSQCDSRSGPAVVSHRRTKRGGKKKLGFY